MREDLGDGGLRGGSTARDLNETLALWATLVETPERCRVPIRVSLVGRQGGPSLTHNSSERLLSRFSHWQVKRQTRFGARTPVLWLRLSRLALRQAPKRLP